MRMIEKAPKKTASRESPKVNWYSAKIQNGNSQMRHCDA